MMNEPSDIANVGQPKPAWLYRWLERVEPTLGSLEPAYRQHFLANDVAQVRGLVPIVVIAVLLQAPIDYQFSGLSPQLAMLYSLRVVLIAMSLYLYFQLPKITDINAVDRLLVLWISLICTVILVVNLARPVTYFYNAPIDVVGVMLATFLVPNNLLFRALPTTIYVIIDIVIFVMFKQEVPAAGLQATITGLVFANIIGIQVSGRFYGQRRQQFLAQYNEQQARREIERLAATDPLTQSANRRHFFTIGEQHMTNHTKHNHALALLFLDIDHFKRINDNYGHASGDEVLKVFSAQVRQVLRNDDLLGRLGGEEFAVLLPGLGVEEANIIAERIRSTCASLSVTTEGGVVQFTTSIGVSMATATDTGLDSVLNRADAALYRAKTGGRNRVVCAA
jgi:diguanylate cyclase (GGDEF)-like protein